MKNLYSLIIGLAISASAYAASYSTNGTGLWDLNATWGADGYPQLATDNASINNNDSVWITDGLSLTIALLEFNQNSILYIPVNTTLTVDSIRILNNAKLYVEGTLIVTGGVYMKNLSALDISLTGTLTVGGDFQGNQNVAITNDGDLSIAGDLFLANGAALTGQGTVTASTYSGTGTVYGSDMADLTAGTTYKAGTDGTAWVLPIQLTVFKAYQTSNNVELIWQTASEVNNNYFTIERSTDGLNYNEISTINGAGNSSSTLNYSYIDNNPAIGTSYYRLKQTDYDGAYEIFDAISVSYLNEQYFAIGPNPVIETLHINIDAEMGKSDIAIYNIIGRRVKTHDTINTQNSIDVSDLPSGTYMIVISANENKISKKIIIN